MHSPESDSDSDSSEESRRPAEANELKLVDNERIFNLGEISAGPKNLKRKFVDKNQLREISKIQRFAPNHASHSRSHCEDSANTDSEGTNLAISPQPREQNEGVSRASSLNHEETYPASGLKQSLHGVVYQLKHLMLVLNHAREMGYPFRLATEMDAAEKFDDLVLQYQNNTGDKIHRFVQLKHRQNESQPIKASDLLADTDGPFSVKKYFISWRKIKQNSVFSRSILEDFILCTNTGLAIEELKEADIGVSKMKEQDDFLTLKDRTKQPPRYKLVVNKHSELYDQLKTTSDVHQLAQILAQRVRDSQKLDLRADIFKRYHVALAQEVIDVRNNRFSDNFIRNNLSATAKRFREVFSKQLLSNQHASENDVRKRLETCKLGLSDKFGKNLPSTHESELKQATELPNDQIEDVDISDFLNVFTIAVDQPNEVELGEMIRRELGDNSMFSLLDASLVGDSFQNDILNRFKDKSGVFLKEENVQAFFKEIEVKLSSIMTMGLNLDYLGMLKRYDISFERQNRDLLNFLDSSGSTREPILQLISSQQSLVTALRVHQTLKQITKYKKTDSFIFMRLRKLLPPETTETVLRAFGNSSNNNLIVIDCGSISATADTDRLWSKLNDAIANNAEKRMILIVQGDNDSAVRFQIRSKISHEEEDDISIDNLKKHSKQKLLEKRVVKFQGQAERTSFGRLLDIRDCDDVGVEISTELSRIVDVDTLVRLIRGEEIRIGSEMKGLGEIQDYYIPRTIIRHGDIKADILNEDKFADQNEPGRVIVLSDIAGMGKSTVLADLAKKLKEKEPNLLVISIDLNQKTSALAEQQRNRSFGNNDTNAAVDFLVEKLSCIKPGSESQLFKTLIKDRGNAALILDGFDEICPEYDNTVIDLLQALAKLRIKKLIVSTRPYAYKKLEEQEKEGRFSCVFYTLRPFSVRNQTEFLMKFWNRGWRSNDPDGTSEDHLLNHAEDVINLLARSIDDRMNEFTGIPLQTRLVAENFQYPSDTPETVNVIDLYRGFVRKKYDVYRTEKKGADSTKQAEISDLAIGHMMFTMTHQKFALEALFKGEVKMLLSSQPKVENCLDLFQSVIEGGERTGIITEVIEGEPYFIHRTFAEYFAAEFLFNALKDDCKNQHVRGFFLKKLFVESKYSTIRCFLECLLPDVSHAPAKEPWRFNLRQYCGYFGETVYHIAAAERKLKIISYFANCLSPTLQNITGLDDQSTSGSSLPTKIKDEGSSPSQIVAKKLLGDYPLERRTDVDIPTQYGETPLHIAVKVEGNLNVVKYLLENGASIESRDGWGKTVLHKAVNGKAGLDVVKYLLEKGAHINALTEDGTTVLQEAIDGEADLNVVKYLLKEGVDIDAVANDGMTPLHNAVHRQSGLEVMKILLDQGANINSLNKQSRTVLHLAILRGAGLDVVKYLTEKGAKINSFAKDGKTPLHNAVEVSGYLNVVKYLVDKGADINSVAIHGRTVLHDAVSQGADLDIVKYLVEKGANINSVTNDSRTALHDAVRRATNSSIVKYLLEKGANINSVANDGRAVLHDAVNRRANLDVVKYLLAKGAGMNSVANDGRTVLHDALGQKSDLDVVKSLFATGASIDSLIRKCDTVCKVDERGVLDMVKYLLQNGANINSVANDGRTALHDAVRRGPNSDIVKYFLEKGPNNNSAANDGRTDGLHETQRSGADLYIVKYLLEKGASINPVAEDGGTVSHDGVLEKTY